MLTVERKDAAKRTVEFQTLPIGEVYRDEEGYIAIKISNKDKDNCLTLGWDCEKKWSLTGESLSTQVTPLDATLTVWE